LFYGGIQGRSRRRFAESEKEDRSPMRLHSLIAVFLIAGFSLVGPAPVAAAADSSPPLTIIEPYGGGSATDRLITMLRPELEKRMGHTVKIEHASGEAGGSLAAQLAAAPHDGSTVMVVDLLSLEIADAAGNPAARLSELTPIAKLAGPGSLALVVGDASPIKNWADFAAAAKGPLGIAFPGRLTGAGVPVALMEKALGTRFRDVVAQNRNEVLAALADKRAEAGLLVTITLLPANNFITPPVRPIVTFGAERNRLMPQVPTLQESTGQRKASITTAIALFGPPGMDAATVERLTATFIAADRVAAKNGSAPTGARLEPGGPDVLRETMQRDARVIGGVMDLLR
jgi:tripartite-type tricarboxylate transporter receptor subunit TctC